MRRIAVAARLRDAFARRRDACSSSISGAAGDAARSLAGQAAAAAPREWVTGNMAAVLTGVRQLEFLPWALPATPPHGHVRVALQRVGICGSDVHYFQRGRIGDFVVNSPLVLGHEASGEVVQLGGGVLSLRVGARVALEPGVPCWQSPYAREGRYNLDPGIVFSATPPHHGSLCSFVDHPADWCYELPQSMSYEEGAFCEPLSVGVHAVRRGGVSPGKRVAILGAGPIGLMALMSARVFGADRIVVSDLEPEKLNIARSQGAHDVVHVSRDDTPEDTAARLCAALGAHPDVVIDCCGFENTMEAALLACNRGGRVVLVGMGSATMRLALSAAATKEVDIIGSFRYANTYPLCISLMSSKRVDVMPLVTHRFGWSASQLLEGFETAASGKAIKVMFCDLAEQAQL